MRAWGILQMAAGSAVIATAGCGIVAPSCLDRQKRGAVFSLDGEVGAGSVAVHRVQYGTEGSQNDLQITWPGQMSGAARIKVYATSVGCVDFSPAAASGACALVGGAGGTLSPTPRPCVTAHTCQPSDEDIIQSSLTITNGQGNPDVLGTPAEYTLWVVGDPQAAVRYSITATYFRGPDC
jgi:hypothetical protein